MTGKRSVVLPLLHWLLSDLFDRFSTSANFWLWKCKKLETGFSFLLYFILRWPSPIPLLEILLYNFIYVQPWRLLWIPNLYIPFTFPCGCTIVISIRFTFQRELFLHTFFFFNLFLPILVNGTAIYSVSQAKTLKDILEIYLAAFLHILPISMPFTFISKPVHFLWFSLLLSNPGPNQLSPQSCS